MAQIIIQLAHSAQDIKREFEKHDRDDFPIGVYHAIYEFIEEQEEDYAELDVIDWCCSINSVSFDDDAILWCDETFDNFDDLVAFVEDDEYVLFIDDANGTIYYLD